LFQLNITFTRRPAVILLNYVEWRYRNKNIFWRWIEIKFVFFCRGLQTQKKVVHIIAYKEFVLLLQCKCMLMRGLCVGLNIPIFWVSFLWAQSLVEKFCGELKNRLEQPFPPFSENIFTGSFSPAPYESYTKGKKKKNTHEDKGENGYGIW